MFRPMVLPPASYAPRLAASMMPGPAAGSDHKAVPPRRNRLGPLGQHAAPAAAHPRSSAPSPPPPRRACAAGQWPLPAAISGDAGRLLVARRGLARAGVLQQLQFVVGLFAAAKPRRAEEHHRVLNLLPAESRQRLQILRHNPNQPPVGAVQECRVLIGQRRARQRGRRVISRNRGSRLGIGSAGRLVGWLLLGCTHAISFISNSSIQVCNSPRSDSFPDARSPVPIQNSQTVEKLR